MYRKKLFLTADLDYGKCCLTGTQIFVGAERLPLSLPNYTYYWFCYINPPVS
jgi:hypothetical protein